MNLSRIVKICSALIAILHPIAKADLAACNERLRNLDWTQKYFEMADFVFLGVVVAEETLDPVTPPLPSSNHATSMADLLKMIESPQARQSPSDQPQKATFSVDKSWKGAVGSTIEVAASLYADDTGYYPVFSIGETYLVFAFKGDDASILHVPIGCASHHSADETGSKIRVLDALTRRSLDP